MTEIELKSDVKVDYSRLEELLANQQWYEADRETWSIMISILPHIDEGFVGDMNEFPCEDLQTIDQLWTKHSNGHFGFSIQSKIWQDLGENLEQDDLFDRGYTQFDDVFAPHVGWKKGSKFLNWEELDYSLNAPQGQLPAMWVNSDTVVAASGQIYQAWKRLKYCQSN